jgi:Flp pilus assembly protein TadB
VTFLVAVLGAGFGLGLLVVARAVRPRPVALAQVLAHLDAPIIDVDASSARGAAAQRLLAAVGVHVDASRGDFVLVGRSGEEHALRKLATGLAAVAATGGLATAMAAQGASIGVGISVAIVAGVGGLGFVFPDLALREEAVRRRRAFRHALSAYLDLVNVILAGGGGIDSALHAAAEAGDGPAFAQLRHALARARLTNRSPWDVFAELGARLEVSELAELAASVSLAGTHGARIRASLAAKADALRGHQQAEVEADAEAATERMTIPVAVLLFGFLVFIAYPALIQITSITQTR